MVQKKRNTIALIYDFDGTLSPQPMQEYTVLPEIGLAPAKFWDAVNKEAEDTGGEPIVTYMRLMYEHADAKKVKITRNDLKALGHKVEYFKGVETWFDMIDTYIAARADGHVDTRHYIISSGLKEILEGVSIYERFHNVFASEYYFDHYGRASYPNRVITDTTKTQYLFRINKGVEDLAKSINSHMPMEQRPIPFSNMIYYGDGMTDVPSMAVTRQNGGYSMAVYPPRRSAKAGKALFEAGRVDFYAAADYREGSDLHRRTQVILDKMIAGILLEEETETLRTKK